MDAQDLTIICKSKIHDSHILISPEILFSSWESVTNS